MIQGLPELPVSFTEVVGVCNLAGVWGLGCSGPPCNSLHLLPQQNTQRLGVSQTTHSLTTPVVSVATPSLLTQGLPFSAMPTAYNTGEGAATSCTSP